MVDINDWFPNFTMFVLIILPALILFTMMVFFVAWWLNRPDRKQKKTPMDWMDLMKFGTALYLLVPMFRIVEFIRGNIGVEELIRGLFVTDFFNYMVLALITGMMGLFFILKQKIDSWVGVEG